VLKFEELVTKEASGPNIYGQEPRARIRAFLRTAY